MSEIDAGGIHRTSPPRLTPELDLATFLARCGAPRPPFPVRTISPSPEFTPPIPRLITSVCAALIGAIALAHFITSGSAALFSSPPAQAAAPSGVPTSSAESPPLETIPGTPVDFPWLFTYRDGLPARWPFGPIGYRLVTEGAPEGAQDLLADAVGRISAVSGLQFREDPPVASAGAYQGIDVSWVSSAALGSADPTAIGLGGAFATDGHFTTGYVKISEDCSGSA